MPSERRTSTYETQGAVRSHASSPAKINHMRKANREGDGVRVYLTQQELRVILASLSHKSQTREKLLKAMEKAKAS